MYFADLTSYSYHRAMVDEAVLNIGWLSSDHPFPHGEAPQSLVDGLTILVQSPANLFRGKHYCEFCPPPKTKISEYGHRIAIPLAGTGGNGEIRVTSSKGITYVAPVLILHYVQTHGYLPPRVFVDAVLETWGPDAIASYRAAQHETRRRAEEGSAEAQYLLGQMLEERRVHPPDFTEAAKQFRRAAEQGHAPAQEKLADCYRSGKGVPHDKAEAEKWYHKAAEQGEASAMYKLTKMCNEGEETRKWLRLAFEHGSPEAYFCYGLGHIHGRGVPRDQVKAYALLELAQELGHGMAEGLRQLLAADMKPNDIERAQELARECKNKNYKNCGF